MPRRTARIGIIVSLVAVIGGGLLAPPADAFPGGTYTVTWDGSLNPTAIAAAEPGQTFLLTNDDRSQSILVENDTGQVSSPDGSCQPENVACWVTSGNSVLFTIEGTGVVRITKGEFGELAKLTLGAGATTDPIFVYPTLLLDANGGTCTGTMKFIRRQGQNDTVALPTASTCTRTRYTLLGWARSATTGKPAFSPGETVTIGTETFTLFAVWAFTSGVLVYYDSNVASGQSCMDENGKEVANVTQWSETRKVFDVIENRRTVVQAQVIDSLPRNIAVCRPVGAVLSGWSTKPGDAGAGFFNLPYAGTKFSLTKPLSTSDTSLKNGTTLTLYAVWQYPVVQLHVMNVGTSPSSAIDLKISNVVANWGSTIAAGPPKFAEFMDTIAPSGDCATQPVTIANSVSPGIFTPSIIFQTLDSLGRPAPFTTFAMASMNAIMNITYTGDGKAPQLPSGQSIRYHMPNGGIAFAQTDAFGLTTAGSWSDQTPGAGANYLAIYPCPAPAAGTPSMDPSLIVITQSEKSIFGQVTFDLG